MGFETEFAELLDSQCKIGRPSWDDSDPNSTVGEKTMALVEEDVPFSIQEVRGSVEQLPAGKRERVTHQAFTGPGRDVQPEDVIQATAGPEAGKFFVVGATWKPLSDHLEATLEESEAERKWATGDNAW